ncbi:branched-chain amino acid transport system permease protein [Rhizobium sp. BK077]|uniref:branched-chain amino acid ABC transporter permease n=1 Tax=unclassified Rhizobium TaxID=2613769 RepID=UPI0017EF8E40|nr:MULTISPECIES: branched-chain amino acid ABC transporter permease [unclassified Rhizobium]MBB3302208.1 branched-chain amino acid transport system permease protein [Rhizobium sp. BK112]MBB3371330.1 branched-chain amino acid transport system permease protein [Rhizobium sp. BK077]MBB4182182.1 branched-chain amino acid transport system permease protein [Rhizobium sp. BK109]MBB4255611.1 branched-chain amino acid transport system permease protein [Rhizobium sp. BK008]
MSINQPTGVAMVSRTIRAYRPSTIIALIMLAILVILPLFVKSFTLSTYRDIMLLGLFALSLDIFWGRTGILSFGHATFFGLGAYGMAIASIRFGLDPQWNSLVGLLFGVGLAMLVALCVGYFILYGGVRGAYFTIVTLALTLIANQIAIGWSSMTGGDSGLIGVPPLSIFIFDFSGTLASFYLAFGVLAVSLLVALRLMHGRLGLLLTAIQDNETKVRTLGYPTQRILLFTFVGSAAMAGLAGALYASCTGFVAPDQIALLLSTEVIIWVAVGGSGTLTGAVIGTFVVWQLQQKISSISVAAWPLAIGAFFILLVLVFPKGIPAFFLDQVKRWKNEGASR